MDALREFMNSTQHKVLGVFCENERAVLLLVISRKRCRLFMVALDHGGVAMNDHHEKVYKVERVDEPDGSSAETREVMTSLAGHIQGDMRVVVELAVFRHPYLHIESPNSRRTMIAMDFPFSLHQTGVFLVVRLADMHELHNTIHERVDRIMTSVNAFVIQSVKAFVSARLAHWQFPGKDDVLKRLNTALLALQDRRSVNEKMVKNAIMLYGLLHDISMEAISLEEEVATADNAVFHQVLAYGQKKRRVYKTLDQLRLLEKHVVDYMIALRFRQDHLIIEILEVVTTVEASLDRIISRMDQFGRVLKDSCDNKETDSFGSIIDNIRRIATNHK